MPTLEDLSSRVQDLRQRSEDLWFLAPEQSSQTIQQARLAQKAFRLLKKEVVANIKEIRSSFTASKARVGSPTIGRVLADVFLGSKAVGSMNADERERIRSRQIRTLRPYEELSRAIDDALLGLDRLKIVLERRIHGLE